MLNTFEKFSQMSPQQLELLKQIGGFGVGGLTLGAILGATSSKDKLKKMLAYGAAGGLAGTGLGAMNYNFNVPAPTPPPETWRDKYFPGAFTDSNEKSIKNPLNWRWFSSPGVALM